MKEKKTLKKQLDDEQNILNFIKLWFKGIGIITGALWLINIGLLKLQIDFLLTTTILFTVGISLSGIYMLTQYSKSKRNIKKLNHKIYIEETSKVLEQQLKKSNNQQKNSINNSYKYSYTPQINYNPIQSNTKKYYQTKKRVLKRNKEYRENKNSLS